MYVCIYVCICVYTHTCRQTFSCVCQMGGRCKYVLFQLFDSCFVEPDSCTRTYHTYYIQPMFRARTFSSDIVNEDSCMHACVRASCMRACVCVHACANIVLLGKCTNMEPVHIYIVDAHIRGFFVCPETTIMLPTCFTHVI